MFGLTPFSSHAFSDDGSLLLDVEGLPLTSGLGSVTVDAQATATETGLFATGSVGSVTVDAKASVTLSGVAGTGSVGEEDADAQATVTETGLGATGSVGSVTIDAQATVTETGLAATGDTGTLTVDAQANVTLTGVSGALGLGEEDADAQATVTETGLAATGATGTVNVQSRYYVTGVSATTALGTTTQTADANVTQAGLEATAGISFSPGPTFNAQGNAQLSTAQVKFGSASLLLDGTDDFVTSNENVDLSSGDFTVDMWIRPTSVTGYKGLWQSGTSSLLNVYLIGNQVQGTVAGSTTLFLSSTRISANVWTMISVEREGSVHRLYINGVLEASSSTGNRPDDGVFSVGKNGFGDFNGYIDEVRLSTNARYTGSSFTEPTVAFTTDAPATALLHFDGANGATDIINERNVGVTAVEADANTTVTGVDATFALGAATVEAGASATVVGVNASALLGSETVSAEANITETGLVATSILGSETVTAEANVTVLGLVAAGTLGEVFVWGLVDDAQDPSWVGVDDSASVIWTSVDDAQTTSWAAVDDSQSTTWTLVDDGNTVAWVEIET
jgi:hypothetical protein